jgi:hypothetical protein
MMITKSQTAELLGVMAAFDRRTIGQADVEAWHLVIHDLNQDDCLTAIRDHYAESRDWLMPADIRTRALTAARHRAGQQRAAELQAQRDHEQHAIEAAPVEPVDREALRDKLRALAARGLGRVPKVDKRADDTRRAEALAHLEQLRRNPPVCSCTDPECIAARTRTPVGANDPSAVGTPAEPIETEDGHGR